MGFFKRRGRTSQLPIDVREKYVEDKLRLAEREESLLKKQQELEKKTMKHKGGSGWRKALGKVKAYAEERAEVWEDQERRQKKKGKKRGSQGMFDLDMGW